MSTAPVPAAPQAMRLLLWLKLRGGIRMQARRLKRPSSWIFLLIGGVLAFSWLAMVIVAPRLANTAPPDPRSALVAAEIGLLVLVALTIASAFNYRGLYLPKDEIEMAFSAPLSRGQLVRYRMQANLMRSGLAGVLFAVGAGLRLQNGVFAFLGTFVTMLTVPLVGQAVALCLGGAENRAAKILARFPTRIISGVLGACVGIGVVLLFTDDGAVIGRLVGSEAQGSPLQLLGSSPLFIGASAVVQPWARTITAQSWLEFLPWFFAILAAWVALFEGITRIPVDYRELSLATSADVAKRIQRARRGGWSASQSKASTKGLGRGAPWLFGSGPFGAVAWLKLTTIARKSGRTLGLTALVIVFLIVMIQSISGRRGIEDPTKALLLGSFLLAGLGTIYLCGGLRFDFRSDLELMERIKAWPLPAWKTFLATIAPEVAIVAGLISAAVLGRAAWLGSFHPALVALVAFQPLMVLTWVALDNALFLYAPVRYAPGQEGALQHMGRSVLLVFLRFVFLGIVTVCAILPGFGVGALLVHGFDASQAVGMVAGCVVAWFGLVAVDTALVWFGGRMLVRFDVARDKGL